MAKKQVLKKRKPAAQEGDEAGGEQKKKKRMWWEDELDGQRRSARDGPEENAAYFREEVRQPLSGSPACVARCPASWSDSIITGISGMLPARVGGAHVRYDTA